ncbi:hypothetical protein L2737_06325 [Shewanella electrodiphila]|uniref:Uncharacterized protein n=1 Tax=Shewanella electrodiphila TaxID=934143 RepID=A0ABT0KME9_9GAMM|nr:hypothetical protein [Shewanella electrodiphila]MCL1044944.1 hypothetical protein [Shewanella electrodiphila]
MKWSELPNYVQGVVAIVVVIAAALSGYFGGRSTFYSEIEKVERRIDELEKHNVKFSPFVGLQTKNQLITAATALLILEDEFKKLVRWARNVSQPKFEYSTDPKLLVEESNRSFLNQSNPDLVMLKEVEHYLNTKIYSREEIKRGFNTGVISNQMFRGSGLAYTNKDLHLVRDINKTLALVSSIGTRVLEIEVVKNAGFSSGGYGGNMYGPIGTFSIPFAAKKTAVEEYLKFESETIKSILELADLIPDRIEEQREDVETLLSKLDASE